MSAKEWEDFKRRYEEEVERRKAEELARYQRGESITIREADIDAIEHNFKVLGEKIEKTRRETQWAIGKMQDRVSTLETQVKKLENKALITVDVFADEGDDG